MNYWGFPCYAEMLDKVTEGLGHIRIDGNALQEERYSNIDLALNSKLRHVIKDNRDKIMEIFGVF